jgi:hypothetical protein
MSRENRRWALPMLSSFALLGALLLLAQPLAAQEAKTGATSLKAGSRNSQISTGKSALEKNSASSFTTPAQGGSGTRTRSVEGGWCSLHVVNKTTWFVKLWVDNSYVGTLGKGVTLDMSVQNGTRKIYGQADFDDKSYVPFGPADVPCQDEHTVNLTPSDKATG